MEYANEAQVTEKIGLLQGAETNVDKAIPSWGKLQEHYESRWQKEKSKISSHIKIKFFCVGRKICIGKTRTVYSHGTRKTGKTLYGSLFRAF